jgi:WD40 repeat protein
VRAAREAARLARLREMVRAAASDEDPLVGALVLAELEGQPEPPGGLAAAVKLAAAPIPLAVYRSSKALIAGALSPDGRSAAVTDGGGDVIVWRVDGTGRPIVLSGHQRYASDVAFSRDGSRIATASADTTVRIWRADGAGAPIVLRHGAQVESVLFSPDDAHVLTLSFTAHTVRLWRIDGQGEPVLFKHEAEVGTAAISPDGARVLTAGGDGIRLWRADGTPLAHGPGPTSGAQFSPDGTKILSAHSGATNQLPQRPAAGQGEMRVWNADLSASIALPDALPPIMGGNANEELVPPSLWSPDGRQVVHRTRRGAGVSNADGRGIIFEVDLGEKQLLRFSPDGSRLLTLDGKDIRLWPIAGKGGESTVLRGHGGPVRTTLATFSADGSRVLTVSNDGSARIWPVGDPPGVRGFRAGKRITNVAVSPDGKLLLATLGDGTARLWPVAGGAPVELGAARLYAAGFGAFHPDGTRVAIAANDGLEVFSVADGKALARPIAGVPVGNPAYSPDGVWLAATEGWNAPHFVTRVRADGSGEPSRRGLPDTGLSLSYTPDGSRLAVATFLGVRVWPADLTGEPLVLSLTGGLIQAVFSPGGEAIMTSTSSGKTQFWSVDGRRQVAPSRPGGGPVAWSPDGSRVAVGLLDGSARVTRLDGSDEPVVVDGPVTGLAFSADGRLVTSGGGKARLWLLDWNDLLSSLRSATTACLSPEERGRHLGESPARAHAAWKACERRHGRAP